jgi:AcrR family transcriptional regulator
MRNVARREDIRDLILDAVDVLLARYGYKKMTMDDLARQVGIGKGTIYLHFPGKEELILSHVDRIAGRVAARLREIAASPEHVPDRLRAMLLARVLIRFDSVFHYSQGLSDLLSSVRTALIVRREGHFDTEARIFENVIKSGVLSGSLDCSDPKSAARALIQATNALLPFSLSSRELGRRVDVEAEAAGIADLLLKGLANHIKNSHSSRGSK